MNPSGTLLLTRDDLHGLLDTDDYLEIVDVAFRAHAEGRTLDPALMHVDADGGEFHIKAGGIDVGRKFFALKSNGGFFGNGARFGMPPIQGVILLCDAENGYPLALMDSTAITMGRTGATTALAAQYLAREDAKTVTICGAGNQGAEHLRFITRVRPIETAYAWDMDVDRAVRFAREMAAELGITVRVAADLHEGTSVSDICITCTPSRSPFFGVEHVRPGMFIAAVGADSPDKQELDPRVLASSKVVVDLTEQCVNVGELHHAIEARVMCAGDVHAELGELLVGKKRGRTSSDEVFVFDATGTALQDAAAAASAFSKAVERQQGKVFDFFSRV